MDRRYQSFIFQSLLRPLLLPVYWLVNGMYRILFGWLDVHASKAKQTKLQLELQETLPFLFGSRAGVVIPSVSVPFPEPFDYATVTILYGNAMIRFVRGRGELNVDLARSKSPHRWYDLLLVLAAINECDELPERRWISDLSEVATILRSNMARLSNQFGSDTNGDVDCRLRNFEAADRASMREWEFDINSRLR